MKLQLKKYIEDILIILGSLFIISGTFFISYVSGLMVTGVFLILFGIYFSLFPPSEKEKRQRG